jgi:hypothetical protein
MERRPLVHVVILYLHPLLGEGLAKLLSAETGIQVTAICQDDAVGAAIALAGRPDVIVEERRDGTPATNGLGRGFASLRLFVGIDGSPVAGANQPLTVDPEVIVRAVRAVKHRRMGLVSA